LYLHLRAWRCGEDGVWLPGRVISTPAISPSWLRAALEQAENQTNAATQP
jgi:hypothetical protein